MRKLGLLIGAVVSLIIGCGTAPAENTSVNLGIDTKIYHGVAGDVEIPSNPKAVVADYYTGELLKLRANLVGADLTYVSSAWQGALGNVQNIGQSLEAVAALKPDLIITFQPDLLEQYQNLAPTVLIPYGTYNPEALIVELSKITNTTDIAEAWVADFNARVETLRTVMPNSAAYTLTIADAPLGAELYLYGAHYGRGGYILYNKLGFKGTETGERDYIRKPESYVLVTPEALPMYVGDILLMINADGTPEGDIAFTKDLTRSELWKNLDSVKNGRVYYFKSEDFAYSDPFSLDLQINLLTQTFGA